MVTLAEILAAIISGALVTSATIYSALVAIGVTAPPGLTVAQLISFIQQLIASQGGKGMACATSHNVSSQVQGPGVCCAALTAAGFGPGNPPPIGTRVAAMTAATSKTASHCIVCQVSASTSKKHPGAPVIKRGKNFVAGSTVNCPTTAGGCCALVGQ